MNDIFALQRGIRHLKYQVAALKFDLMLRRMARDAVLKYDPNQPRVPAGNPDGGQWTETGWSRESSQQTDRRQAQSTGSDFSAARRISPATEARCEAQRIEDELQCRMVGIRACSQQAYLRYANCLRGLPIPPLTYF